MRRRATQASSRTFGSITTHSKWPKLLYPQKQSAAGRALAEIGTVASPSIPFLSSFFTDVLLHSLTPDDHKDLSRLHNLSLVQVAWWGVVKTCPAFWTVIHCGDPKISELKLRKSSGLPLDVICTKDAKEDDLEGLIVTLGVEPRRYRSFSYHWHTAGPLHSWSPQFTTVTLETVILKSESFDQYMMPVELPADPSLKVLVLEKTAVRWKREMGLADLKTLKLNDCMGGLYMPSLDDFFAALGALPCLEVLELDAIDPETATSRHKDSIHLPRLRQLSLTDVAQAILTPLLSFIHSEQPEHLAITYTDEVIDPVPVALYLFSSQTVPPFLAEFLEFQGCSEILVTFDDFEVEVQGTLGGGGKLDISFLATAVWFSELAGSTHLSFSSCEIPIHLKIIDTHGYDQAPDVNLTAYRTVTSVTMHCGPRTAVSVIQALSGPRAVPGGGEAWACPRLKRLDGDFGKKEDWENGDDDDWEALKNALDIIYTQRNGAHAHSMGVAGFTLATRYVDDGLYTSQIRSVLR